MECLSKKEKKGGVSKWITMLAEMDINISEINFHGGQSFHQKKSQPLKLSTMTIKGDHYFFWVIRQYILLIFRWFKSKNEQYMPNNI